MITQTKRNAIRQRIHSRIRRKLAGSTERPRLNVYRSLNHIYAQVIDDQTGVTLTSAADRSGRRYMSMVNLAGMNSGSP